MGNTGLRCSIQNGRWEKVRTMLRDDQSAKERATNKTYRTKDSKSPIKCQYVTALHLACLYDAPVDIIRTLIEIKPAALEETSNPYQETPIHAALRISPASMSYSRDRRGNNNLEAVIKLLLEQTSSLPSPDGIPMACRQSSPDPPSFGATPLHIACAVCASHETIRMLRDVDPRRARDTKDDKGHTAWDVVVKGHGITGVGGWVRDPKWRWGVGSILSPGVLGTKNKKADGAAADPSAPPMPMPPPTANGAKAAVVSAGDDVSMCVVCWDGVADCAVVPCGHMCLCADCAENPVEPKCPVCRGNLDSVMKVFRAGVPDPETKDDKQKGATAAAVATTAPTTPKIKKPVITTPTSTPSNPQDSLLPSNPPPEVPPPTAPPVNPEAWDPVKPGRPVVIH